MSPKLLNISERNIKYFPGMHARCKLKAKRPSWSGSKCIWRDSATEEARVSTGQVSHTVGQHWRVIRSSSLMGLTHQTLLTSTSEWNLRSHMESISQVKPALNERGTRASAASRSWSPADSSNSLECITPGTLDEMEKAASSDTQLFQKEVAPIWNKITLKNIWCPSPQKIRVLITNQCLCSPSA